MSNSAKTIFLCLIIMLLWQLQACAPGAHVRVGVGVHVPGSWTGPYPYPPPRGPVRVGRPPGGRYYPMMDYKIRDNYTLRNGSEFSEQKNGRYSD